MRIARARGRLKGKQPKLTRAQEDHLLSLVEAGDHTIGQLVELFNVTRSTIYRSIARARARRSEAPSVPVPARPRPPTP